MKTLGPALLLAGIALAFTSLTAAPAAVTLREVEENIPTYLAGPPDPNPMFYFGRASQGAEGRIYPYPLYDNLTNRKSDKRYKLVYLENEYVKIGILPEIGGRLFSALDKTNNYDYVYRQHVIKPALIGLIGAWISGGIEWNIPHHHRASTFIPVQYRTEENADGSKTVWVGELEVRHRMRWAVGYTLHPGSSVLECSLRIVNRTPEAHTMLCFANVAVNASENYQIIFPPSTQWVTHHHKREFTQWPIAKQPYGGVDWHGEDVSWYKNHKNANSMFAWNYQDDFFAGYDHGKQAGTMSIADHHIVPGKKFWTWGSGPRGQMWDEILTDTDGPYIELMVGAYSDNQPDYSWLQPFETRSFTMNWYPFRDIGGVKNANLDAAVNLEIKDGVASFGFNTTREYPSATVRFTAGDKVLLDEKISISPAKPYVKQVPVPAGTDEHALSASLSVGDRELVAYSPLKLTPMPQPSVVKEYPQPKEIENNEELFLAGQRIDQFHNAERDADPFWEEVLRRDPADVAANTGLGILSLRRAKFAVAESCFRKALGRLTDRHTTPKNAEPFYYLGVALKAQGKLDEAFDAYFKAAWSQEWKAPAYFGLAEIASTRGDFARALDLVNQSIDANALNVRAYGLKAALLRRLDRAKEADDVLTFAARKTDPLDVRLMAERWLISREVGAARTLFTTLTEYPANAQEIAAEYADAGLWRDGADVLEQLAAATGDHAKLSPLVFYYLGDFAEKLGDKAKAAEYRRTAAELSPDYVFPFQSEAIAVLRRAIEANPQDARAPYYLGNLLFDWQPDEAVALWEKSAQLDPDFAITWRNLAEAYAHKSDDASRKKAIALLEKAVEVRHPYATHFAELGHLYEAMGAPVEKRLALFEKHLDQVEQKDESVAMLINLKTFVGKPDEAIAMLQSRTFNVWEGGTRFNTGEAWADAHLARGLQQLAAKQPREALADFERAQKFPLNLRASEQNGPSRKAEFAYWTGLAHEVLGESEKAKTAWSEAAAEPPQANRSAGERRFRDPLVESGARYYQALALRKLGQGERADAIMREIVAAADARLSSMQSAGRDSTAQDFARGSPRMQSARAHYVAGLGHAGLGDKENARNEFTEALASAPDYIAAKLALDLL
ncbi:MAG TPA: DUF5107 domain-containing protein [Opitutaceae bacterium]|nr:DUF5107 domain-containing protein [Opitutaceae bacterium]